MPQALRLKGTLTIFTCTLLSWRVVNNFMVSRPRSQRRCTCSQPFRNFEMCLKTAIFCDLSSYDDNKGTALPRLVSAIWFSLGWCNVQQGGRQRGFTNHLGDAIWAIHNGLEWQLALPPLSGITYVQVAKQMRIGTPDVPCLIYNIEVGIRLDLSSHTISCLLVLATLVAYCETQLPANSFLYIQWSSNDCCSRSSQVGWKKLF